MTAVLKTEGTSGEPLRREVRLPIYWLVVGLAVMIVSPLLSIYASVQINQHAAAKARQAQAQAEAKQRVEGQAAACRLIGAIIDVYSESVTAAGKRAHDTWLIEYTKAGCQPPRK